MRERVLRRARSIGRRRAFPALLALVLTGALVVQNLSGVPSPSSVRVTGEGEHDDGMAETAPPEGGQEPEGSDEPESTTTTSSTTSSSTTTTTTRRSPRTGIDEPIGVGIYGPGPLETVKRNGDDPLFVDESGDARYHSGCADERCPDGADLDEKSRSQPALDFVAADIRCTDKAMRLSFALLDPDAPLDPNSFGHRVEWILFDTTMWFDDGTERGGHITLEIARTVSTGRLSVRQAHLSTSNDLGTGIGANIPAEHIHLRFVGRSLVVDVAWDAMAEATRASGADRRPPGPGTAVVMSTWSSAYFSSAAGSSYGGGGDHVGYEGWGKQNVLCS